MIKMRPLAKKYANYVLTFLLKNPKLFPRNKRQGKPVTRILLMLPAALVASGGLLGMQVWAAHALSGTCAILSMR